MNGEKIMIIFFFVLALEEAKKLRNREWTRTGKMKEQNVLLWVLGEGKIENIFISTINLDSNEKKNPSHHAPSR